MLFEVESGIIIWEILTFTLLIVTLRVFAWKPIVASLTKREAAIRQSIEFAEEAKRVAERVLEESQDALSRFDQELEKVKLRSHAVVNQMKDSISTAAAKEAERIMDENSREIKRLKDRAIQQLRTEIGGLIVESAALIIDNSLDGAGHRKLVNRALESLPFDGGVSETEVAWQ